MEGKWEGVQTRDTGEVVKTQSEFIVLSDGNTVLERLVEDGMPMMTTYSEEEGVLVVKHYCSLGTEPEFEAALMGDSKMSLALSPMSGYVSGEADCRTHWHCIVDKHDISASTSVGNKW